MVKQTVKEGASMGQRWFEAVRKGTQRPSDGRCQVTNNNLAARPYQAEMRAKSRKMKRKKKDRCWRSKRRIRRQKNLSASWKLVEERGGNAKTKRVKRKSQIKEGK